MARFCVTCGTPLVAETATSCTKCGAAVVAPPNSSVAIPPPPSVSIPAWTTSKKVIVTVGVVFGVFLALGIVAANMMPATQTATADTTVADKASAESYAERIKPATPVQKMFEWRGVHTGMTTDQFQAATVGTYRTPMCVPTAGFMKAACVAGNSDSLSGLFFQGRLYAIVTTCETAGDGSVVNAGAGPDGCKTLLAAVKNSLGEPMYLGGTQDLEADQGGMRRNNVTRWQSALELVAYDEGSSNGTLTVCSVELSPGSECRFLN